MKPISFDTFVQNAAKAANPQNVVKLPEPGKDTVEISSKNQSEEAPKKGLSKKKLFLIGAAAGLAIGGIIAVVKYRNLEKAKEEITSLYNKLFEGMKEDVSKNMNFEKPELVFQRLKKGLGGGYNPLTNQILVDPRDLRHTCILKNMQNVSLTNITDDLQIADNWSRNSVWGVIKDGLSDRFRIATKNEALALTGSTLTHELQHAKQFQLLLSTEGGLEKYIQSLKEEHPAITEEAIKKACPFLFGYKPKMLLDPEKVTIIDDVSGKNKIKYGIKVIIDAFTKYTSPDEDRFKYYTNLTEISAIAKESSYWQKMQSGEIPRPDGVSDEFIEHFRKILSHNAIKLAKIAAERG